jgi:hypothetical protein
VTVTTSASTIFSDLAKVTSHLKKYEIAKGVGYIETTTAAAGAAGLGAAFQKIRQLGKAVNIVGLVTDFSLLNGHAVAVRCDAEGTRVLYDPNFGAYQFSSGEDAELAKVFVACMARGVKKPIFYDLLRSWPRLNWGFTTWQRTQRRPRRPALAGGTSRLDLRPVTPEVAGSSPVGPAKLKH